MPFALVTAFLVADVHAMPPWAYTFSPMQRDWRAHEGLPFDLFPALPFTVARPMAIEGTPGVTILGYLPYWNFGKPSLVLHMDQLDVIAYFGVEVGADGSLGAAHHWGTPGMADLIGEAHSAGVSVVLTVVNFDSDSIHTLLSTPLNRAAAVVNLIELVSEHGGDGVNVDFEGLPKGDKAWFVDFVTALKQHMDEALGGSHVSVATPAVDWSGAFDYDKLAQVCDGLMIMGYDYHWPGGEPGPVSPLQGSDKWGQYSLAWTVSDYLEWGGSENRDRFMLGLPLYGLDWPTKDDSVPGEALGSAKAVTYAMCQDEASQFGWEWDEESSTPHYAFKADQWRQVWCEDAQSLKMKYGLVTNSGLGGIGLWALGYEGAYTDVWEGLEAVFAASPVPDHDAADTLGTDVALTDTGYAGSTDVFPDVTSPVEPDNRFVGEFDECSCCRVSVNGLSGTSRLGILLVLTVMTLIFGASRCRMSTCPGIATMARRAG